MYENELYHYGVKGMKWGVRRYRNEDGSLTPAGKKREQKQTLKDVKKYGRYTSDHVKAMSSKNKKLTDAIDKAEPYVKKLDAARYKRELLDLDFDEAYDAALTKHYNQYMKKHNIGQDRYDNDDAYNYAERKAFVETKKKMQKRFDEATTQYNEAQKEYDDYVKTVVDDLLGEYGDIPVRKRSNSRVSSAASALDDIIFWDNSVEKQRN